MLRLLTPKVYCRGFWSKVKKGIKDADEKDDEYLNVDRKDSKPFYYKLMSPNYLDNKAFAALLIGSAGFYLFAKYTIAPHLDITVAGMENEKLQILKEKHEHGVFKLKKIESDSKDKN